MSISSHSRSYSDFVPFPLGNVSERFLSLIFPQSLKCKQRIDALHVSLEPDVRRRDDSGEEATPR